MTGGPAAAPGTVTVRYWAAARAAAGVTEETLVASTLAQVQDAIAARHGGTLPSLLRRCSYLVDDQPAGQRDPATLTLAAGAVVEVLPPFAGG
ncbi:MULTISPECIES: MoaD/ThiS family protein [Frankia]|uniref:MoaD/ThiS family protein n=1 Tax=Frankia umida TaxID=573489 RepID=A0ABT0JT48_9ACTN|nr:MULTISPECIES: MoaD/ThiS family protein [Frankia]MCK9874718.1 MoaD/ThiS family protein [Frankia umida]